MPMHKVNCLRPLILALVLCCCISLFLDAWAVPTADPSWHVYDYAGLLTQEEETKLATRSENLAERFNLDIVLVCIDDNAGLTTEAFADDFYDINHFGRGTTHDGILLLLDIDSMGFHITTTGKVIQRFSDANIDMMLDNVFDDFAQGYYHAGFTTFLDDVARLLSLPQEQPKVTPTPSGTTHDDGLVQDGANPMIAIIGSALITAFTYFYYTTKQASSLPPAPALASYTFGSFSVTRNLDLFLRTYTRRTAKPKERKTAGSSASRFTRTQATSTRTHTSSSGTRHGGGGRSFSSGSSRSSSSGRSSSSSRSSSSRSSSSRASSSGSRHGGGGRKL